MVPTTNADLEQTSRRRTADARTAYISRWLTSWVILLTVVVLVVVGYLMVITGSLASINGNLATGQRAVAGAGAALVTLPNQVDRINAALGGIDPALRPIPDQADQIAGALRSINAKLSATAASLKDT